MFPKPPRTALRAPMDASNASGPFLLRQCASRNSSLLLCGYYLQGGALWLDALLNCSPDLPLTFPRLTLCETLVWWGLLVAPRTNSFAPSVSLALSIFSLSKPLTRNSSAMAELPEASLR